MNSTLLLSTFDKIIRDWPYVVELFQKGEIAAALGITVWMVLLSVTFSYVLGLPVGIILYVTDKTGIKPNVVVNKILGVIVNIFRSIPFIILMVAFLPVAKSLVGKSYGNAAMVVMLVIGAAPYVARMVESSLKEVDKGVIEAAQSLGANTFQIIVKVLLPEARPSLMIGAIISTVTVIGYTAMAATIGGAGPGALAITQGHLRGHQAVIWTAVVLIVLIVQLIQEGGMWLVKKTDRRVRNENKRKKAQKNK